MRIVTVLSFLILSIIIFSAFCRLDPDDPVSIPPSTQRIGNALKGFDYLTTGNYVSSGIPLPVFKLTGGKKLGPDLGRSGANKGIPYGFNAVKADNGEVVIAPNCLQCHAQEFDGKLIIGLGNNEIDFTQAEQLDPKKVGMMEKFLKLGAPRQYEAAAPFLTSTKTIGPYLKAQVQGVNTADRLASVLAAHRNPFNFEWSNAPLLIIPDEVIPTDTPPWWLLKKKNAMFYNGFGRGDFGRFLMASNLLTVKDTSESRRVDEHMPDVLAYIYSLQPPSYPQAIDQNMANTGKIIFEKNCSSCHGTYGTNSTYPNLLIPESMIQTDSLLYKSNYSNPQFVNWFNNSWFTMGDHPAQLKPFEGYIAPPLDGIWVSAPYLHNGSIPTLEAVLNSSLRPKYWTRNFQQQEYDYDKVGWKYTLVEKPSGTKAYNTDLPGYGNYGHYFGDHLTEAERKAVIEYLKTL